ncbi:MAG TPA: VOC family protein [Reyranella sp.]
MIDHLSITTTDLDRAQTFYDAALGALGYPRVNRRAAAIGYGVRDRSPDAPPYISIYLCTGKLVPDNRHWCFRAKSRAAVRAFHQAALASGGSDDGPPGLRPNYHPDYYGAFVRDPDGNRIEAVTHQREDQK